MTAKLIKKVFLERRKEEEGAGQDQHKTFAAELIGYVFPLGRSFLEQIEQKVLSSFLSCLEDHFKTQYVDKVHQELWQFGLNSVFIEGGVSSLVG